LDLTHGVLRVAMCGNGGEGRRRFTGEAAEKQLDGSLLLAEVQFNYENTTIEFSQITLNFSIEVKNL
jgi:hypothetical protein